MIKAIRKNNELVEDMVESSADDHNFYIWWLGQSGYLLQYKNQRILIDPYLSDSLTKKYSDTEKPHTRISELVISPEQLPPINFITSSHNHTDHLDAESIIPILKKNNDCKLCVPEANRIFVCDRLKIGTELPLGLDAGETIQIGNISITAVPAAHNTIEKDENGKCKFLGYIFKFGNWCIYHSGDTLMYDGMSELLKSHNPDIVILPINGNDPKRKVAGNLNCNEAIALAKEIGNTIVIPCHYDLFEFNTADINEFIELAKRESQEYCVLDLGGKFSSNEL